MKPSPYQISAFNHAAREGSFSRAATRLGVSQSSITQHVSNLETTIGSQLFIRRRDGLELTRVGRELFGISDRLVTIEQLIEEKIESDGSLRQGILRIAATAPRPAMPIIQRFTADNPGIDIEFSLFSWTLCTQMLRDRTIDIAIYTAPEPAKGLFIHRISQTRYLAYCRKDHRLAARSSISLMELAREFIILPEDGSLTQRVFKRKLAECGATIRGSMKTTTFAVLKEAVLHGIGIGILLEDSLYPTNNLVGIPIPEMPETYADCLVTQSDKQDLRLVRQFLEVANAI
jgi:LysR family transcriptional regulator, low CO2-responsive transcriptional regulator